MEAAGEPVVLVVQEDFPLKGARFKKDIDRSRQQKLPFVRLWDMCNLFLQGKQHLRFDRNSQYWVGDYPRNKRHRVTINMILNIYRNMLARLSMAYPSLTVLPASDSVEDIVKAQSSETALKWYWHSSNVKDTLIELIESLLLTGNAALHTYYDADKDEVLTKAISAYDLFFEAGAATPDESRWCAVRTLVHKKELARAFPDHAEFINKSPAPSIVYNTSLNQTVAMTQGYNLQDRVEIFEVFHKDGYTGILLQDKWLHKSKLPANTMPLQFVNYTHVPGRVWGIGLIEPLLELQVLYNRGRGQITENVELMGNPKWLIPKNAGISKNALSTSKPGEKVFYNANAGPAPQQIAAAPMPQYVYDNIKQLSAEMMDVAGIHSTSLGKRAIGIESGAAIEALAGKDMQQLQVTQENIEQAVRDMGNVVLKLMKNFFSEERMIRIMDATGQVVFRQLRSTELVDDPEIFIEAGSLFRDEKQDRDKKILELMQLGLLDREQALQELDFKTGNAYVTAKMRGLSHAQEMLNAVTRGHMIEIFPTDDIQAFIKVFGDFVQTKMFYELSPDRQQYIRDVLISCVVFGQPDEEAARAHNKRTVFPRVTDKEQNARAIIATSGSPEAQQQVAGAYSNSLAQRRAVEGNPSPEQGLSNVRQGGTG